MTRKSTILLSAAIVPTLCITACSDQSDNTYHTYDIDETQCLASVPPMHVVEDSISVFEIDEMGYTTAIYLDSAEFCAMMGDCVLDSIDRTLIQDISIKDIEMNSLSPSRATYGKYFGVLSSDIGNNWKKVTIRCGKMNVTYETEYLYEFPRHTSDLTQEYKIRYELSRGEYLGAAYVQRPSNYELKAGIDILTHKGGSNYETRKAAFKVRIVNEKFQLMGQTNCD